MNWAAKYGNPLSHLNVLDSPNYKPYTEFGSEHYGIIEAPPKPVLIDGVVREASAVNPLLHDYLGIFRPPSPPTEADLPNISDNFGGLHGAWNRGVFDLSSYASKQRSRAANSHEALVAALKACVKCEKNYEGGMAAIRAFQSACEQARAALHLAGEE